MSESNSHHVSVIGAGIVGVCCALTLKSDGHRVTLFDPRQPGTATSFGNAGIVADGAVIPYSTPGLWRRLPWMLFSPMSPLKLRNGYLLGAAPWVARFLAEGRPGKVDENSAAMASVSKGTFEAHRRLMKAHGLDAGLIRPTGSLDLYRSRAALEKGAWARHLYERHAVRTELLSADEIRQMEPALSGEIEGGLFFPDRGFVPQPIKLTQAYFDAFLRIGGEIRHEHVRRFEFDGADPVRIVTDLGMYRADRVVLCAGAWSKALARELGARVPLDTERGYHLNLAHDPEVTINRPVIVADDYFVFAPMNDGLRITSGAELGGLELAPDFRRIHRIAERARAIAPKVKLRVTREWMGYRPSMPDSRPVIGRSSRSSRVYFAFGHGHLGLTQSALSAQLIADLVAGRQSDISLAPFSPDRFL